MEKFRKYSDPQTGLNLFIPAYTNYKLSFLEIINHLVYHIIKYLLGFWNSISNNKSPNSNYTFFISFIM